MINLVPNISAIFEDPIVHVGFLLYTKILNMNTGFVLCMLGK